MRKIKKDDMVRIIAGKDKGRDGKVLSVDVKNGRVIVEGINMVTKHQKPTQGNPQGGIVKCERPIDVSNVMLLADGQPTKVGFRMEGDKKVRFAKKTGKVIA